MKILMTLNLIVLMIMQGLLITSGHQDLIDWSVLFLVIASFVITILDD